MEVSPPFAELVDLHGNDSAPKRRRAASTMAG
jgi:hypothetical protein